jgi:hypothetical protein
MRYVRFEKRSAWPSWWALVFLGLCCAGSMFVTFRAAAQNGTDQNTTVAVPPVGPSRAATPAGRPGPSKPEESATIPDDPTIVPDDKESADNNVTFPVDI